jgi:Autographiviridae endonuclease VII
MKIALEGVFMRICKVQDCNTNTIDGHSVCPVHKYRWFKYKSYDVPKKEIIPIPDGYVKICKHHGNLKEHEVFKRKNYLRCKYCHQEYYKINIEKRDKDNKDYRTNFPDKVKTDNKEWRLKNKEYNDERIAKWRGNNPDKVKFMRWRGHIKFTYKITSKEYDEMIEQQNGLCKICNKPETKMNMLKDGIQRLSVDHCHKTGKVRGLLCGKCNTALGSLRDSIDTLNSAIAYLSSHVD